MPRRPGGTIRRWFRPAVRRGRATGGEFEEPLLMNACRIMSRRSMLLASAAASLALFGRSSRAWSEESSAPFVLVHGGWHGGWCWQKLVPRLTSAGHWVLTPTLTGLGERSHLLGPEVDLDTHIRDVAAVLKYEDLQKVVLVGHSYGGMVISGVAETAGSRVAHLVY